MLVFIQFTIYRDQSRHRSTTAILFGMGSRDIFSLVIFQVGESVQNSKYES